MGEIQPAPLEWPQNKSLDLNAAAVPEAAKSPPENAEALHALGVRSFQRGDYAQAVAAFSQAVALRPNKPEFHCNLGEAYHALGRLEPAASCYRMALWLAPDFPEALSHLGMALQGLGQPTEALAYFRRAVQLRPDFAKAQGHLGISLRQLGQFAEAHVHLRQAVELEPKNVLFWEQLAALYDQCGEPAAAIPCWERALALAPDREIYQLSLGWALQQVGRSAEAEQHYRAVLEGNPTSDRALVCLGTLHTERGEMAEAETAYRTALRLAPTDAATQVRLATMLGGKATAADVAALKERLADVQCSGEVRASLSIALAHVFNGRGDYPGAAQCARQSHALSREQARRDQRDYNAVEHEQFVVEMCRLFDRDFLARTAGLGSTSQRPVFVFGLPRSGTTLVAQILGSHPRVHVAGELRLALDSLAALPAALGSSQPPLACVPQMTATAIQQLAEQHLDGLRRLDGGRAERIVNKMPDNYLYLGFLMTLFPDAVFIHCRRAVRDVAVSCWLTPFLSLNWTHTPEHIASRFRQYYRLMDHWRTALPKPIHEVRYEDLVAHLEEESRRLLAACKMDWTPACLEFYRSPQVVRSSSMFQVRQPIYRHAVGRWKNYERELADLFALLPRDES